ncbi:alanine racemase [Paenibacillus nasutitermitis]|uniref:Alanine racemase n=1 Tax=Paenibacillus nasutitermitis TaxID=1652958 RepID=A0A916ZK73_9BACL|nr:alanine racemase [Paenibacillus nasutitermitis]GGE01892.1 alanine racemase [Paenibacillus nasutitermitis]
MDAYYRPTRAEISLDALAHNLHAFRKAIPEGMRMMASVKANAYGHGAVEVAREAEACGIDYLGVAFLDEAIELRKGGIQTPILVLGYVPPEGLAVARDCNIAVALFREDILEAASRLSDNGKRLTVHVKVDTGMGRLGLLPGAEALSFVKRAAVEPRLFVEGMFTHYARADEADKSYTQLQYERFTAFVREVKHAGLDIPLVHAANSAAGIDTPELGCGMLRLGISMYGMYPSLEVNRSRIRLKPVLSLKTQIAMVKAVPEGWGISYGSRYVTVADGERIGTLPIGYADGFSRMMSGKAIALVRGRRVPVLGTICMDQCMIALNGVDSADQQPVVAGEEVVLIGTQDGETITADEVAAILGTINYEVTCMIASRVPRIYIRGDRQAAVENPLLD